jgi:hypothetical protein
VRAKLVKHEHLTNAIKNGIIETNHVTVDGKCAAAAVLLLRRHIQHALHIDDVAAVVQPRLATGYFGNSFLSPKSLAARGKR